MGSAVPLRFMALVHTVHRRGYWLRLNLLSDSKSLISWKQIEIANTLWKHEQGTQLLPTHSYLFVLGNVESVVRDGDVLL